jgi:hypothetical protein
LVLRLNQEIVHDIILLFMPPSGPHLTPLATRSLERSLLVFSTPGGLAGDDLSRLFFTAPTPVLTVKFRQPSHEFTFGVGMTFVFYPLVLTPVV